MLSRKGSGSRSVCRLSSLTGRVSTVLGCPLPRLPCQAEIPHPARPSPGGSTKRNNESCCLSTALLCRCPLVPSRPQTHHCALPLRIRTDSPRRPTQRLVEQHTPRRRTEIDRILIRASPPLRHRANKRGERGPQDRSRERERDATFTGRCGS
jgi:hypothetical protein